jgi:hypothetical protein
MSVRFGPWLLSELTRAHEYQVEPGFATAVVTVLGARFDLAAVGQGPRSVVDRGGLR